MAQGDITIYNSAKKKLLDGVFDLVNDTIKVTLHNGYTPNIDTHDEFADVSATEYGTASGYTAGGVTLGSKATTVDTTNDRALWDAADAAWTSLGPLSPATPSHAIIWDDTIAGDPLLAFVELGTTATNGGNYTIQWSASPAAIISLT